MVYKQDVIFAFDDINLESSAGVKLKMIRPEKHESNPILERGKVGDPDEYRCGTNAVIYDKGLWRMWYSAHNAKNDIPYIAYAESMDGFVWKKPKLRLVEFNNTLENNIVKAEMGLNTVSIIYDDSIPEYKYVMVGNNTSWSINPTRIDISKDGLSWVSLNEKPGIIEQMNEVGTIYKFNGIYHIGASQGYPMISLPMQESIDFRQLIPQSPQTFVVWRSPVLGKWPLERTIAFSKPILSSSPHEQGWNGEEVHVGAAVTAYRNVCLGIYGQWHYPINKEPYMESPFISNAVSSDLGLIISNDGIHFREPAPGFSLIKRDQEIKWDRNYKKNIYEDNIILTQSSLINTEKTTYVFYSAITPEDKNKRRMSNAGLALLPRDRFGYLELIEKNNTGQITTRSLSYDKKVKLFLNTDIPENSRINISIIDANGNIIEKYNYITIEGIYDSCIEIPVNWKETSFLPKEIDFRIRFVITGKAKIYAIYIRDS